MKQASFFREESAVAARQAKTDPLFLVRTVREASIRGQISDHDVAAAHKVLIKWADLDKSGQLASKSETQQQGDFLEEIFGKALGYRRMVVTLVSSGRKARFPHFV